MASHQITINIPNNLPEAILEQEIKEFEKKLIQLTVKTGSNNKSQKLQAIQQIIKRCEKIPIIDDRTADQVLGYEHNPMGLLG